MTKQKKIKICDNTYEMQYWSENCLITGIDEAGRGPLAGPLSVAGVVFPVGYHNEEIYDSKSLSEKQRNRLYDIIIHDALWYEIMEVDEANIDRYNILEEDRTAMRKIALDSPGNVILTDAMKLGIDRPVIDLVKGDQKSISIAAASILAKVTRDRIMEMYDGMYPQYGLGRNKGYPTKAHMEAIDVYGITPIHRRSFGPVKAKQISFDF